MPQLADCYVVLDVLDVLDVGAVFCVADGLVVDLSALSPDVLSPDVSALVSVFVADSAFGLGEV
jgi:hypothetical protein